MSRSPAQQKCQLISRGIEGDCYQHARHARNAGHDGLVSVINIPMIAVSHALLGRWTCFIQRQESNSGGTPAAATRLMGIRCSASSLPDVSMLVWLLSTVILLA